MASDLPVPGVAARLATFVAATGWDDLAPALRDEAKRSILNFVGCALGVSTHTPVDVAVRVLAAHAGRGEATVFGRRERLDAMSAAFVNAVAGNLLDFDDTHLPTVIHPTAPVAPPALALAETRGLAGADLLAAFVLGAEVECRIGNAVSPGHYARGWHITSTCGVLGAAAATSKLLGLDAERTAHALGLAANQSAGLVENLPTAAKNVSVGNAARNGLFAALLAEHGFTGAPHALEGRLGWARAMGDDPEPAAFTAGLGERWEFLRNTYKPYPCGIVMHAVIDACLELAERHDLAADDVAELVVRGNSLLLERGDREVRDERDARVSIHHAAAAALLWGPPGMVEFSSPRVHSPEAVALRRRVRPELDADLPIGAATVAVRTADGRELASTVLQARGSVEKPLDDAALDDKVRALARASPEPWDPEAVIGAVREIDRPGGVARLMGTLRPAGA